MSARLGRTDKTELVETHNLLLALNRLCAAPYQGIGAPWKRALYHAVAMSNAGNGNILEKLRQALEI